jgi:hypothetical protein
MKIFEVSVTEHMYDILVRKFGSKRRVEEIVSLKIESAIKNALINESQKEYAPRKNFTLLINDSLYTKLNDYCVRRNISKREFMMKKIHRLIE